MQYYRNGGASEAGEKPPGEYHHIEKQKEILCMNSAGGLDCGGCYRLTPFYGSVETSHYFSQRSFWSTARNASAPAAAASPLER